MTENQTVLMQSILAKLAKMEEFLETQLKFQTAREAYNKEILNANECSALLGLSMNQLYKLTCEGAIPHFKLGKHLRFERDKVWDWLKQHQCSSQVDLEKRAANRLAHHSLKRG